MTTAQAIEKLKREPQIWAPPKVADVALVPVDDGTAWFRWDGEQWCYRGTHKP